MLLKLRIFFHLTAKWVFAFPQPVRNVQGLICNNFTLEANTGLANAAVAIELFKEAIEVPTNEGQFPPSALPILLFSTNDGLTNPLQALQSFRESES